jgi:hypothetical protein
MKGKLSLLAAILLATFVVSVERSSGNTDIDGEVFIVMRAGNSIKLGLVEVRLYKFEDAAETLDEIRRGAPEMLATAERRKAEADEVLKRAEKKREALDLRMGYVTAITGSGLKDADQIYALVAASLKGIEPTPDPKMRGTDEQKMAALRKPLENLRDQSAAAQAETAAAAEAYAKIQDELDALKSMQFVVQSLPQPLQTATTNADGKFRFTGLAPGSYLLGAIASREVGEKPERYAWCVPIEIQQESAMSVMLSNHNLLVAK